MIFFPKSKPSLFPDSNPKCQIPRILNKTNKPVSAPSKPPRNAFNLYSTENDLNKIGNKPKGDLSGYRVELLQNT